MTRLFVGGTADMVKALANRFSGGLMNDQGKPIAAGRNSRTSGQPASPTDPAAEIRLRVAIACQSNPHIAANTAENWIAEGITPDQASARLYDLISEPIEADKIVSAYRSARGVAG